MNNLDKQYTALLQDILDNGVEKKDRTGTGTLSVFGRQIRHKMSEGFPLLTTKKMYMKGIITELLWFLRGDTNIKYLVDNDCHIWDGDAYKRYSKTTIESFDFYERGKHFKVIAFNSDNYHPIYDYFTKEEFINKIKTDDVFAKKWGDLGPVYGKQWRSWKGNPSIKTENYGAETWNTKIENNIDQIANLICDLKTNPDSRRLMVNAWNVSEINQMVLPPCHYGFQVYTRELSLEERLSIADKFNPLIREDCLTKTHHPNETEELKLVYRHEFLDNLGPNVVPQRRAISLMWNQRSVDTFLGLPFNIASYGLLLEIIAKEVNMVPDELIGNLGDVHLYLNHIEQAKEQIGRTLSHDERCEMAWPICYPERKGEEIPVTWNLKELTLDDLGIPRRTRQPYPLPKLNIFEPAIGKEISILDNLHVWSPDCFIIENYQSHPTIKAPLSN
jgi:thymidylate synthase